MQAAAAAAASGVRSPERMPSGPARGWEDADSALESGGGRARSAGGGRAEGVRWALVAAGGRTVGLGRRGSGLGWGARRRPVAHDFSWPLSNPVIRVTRSSLLREGDGRRQKLAMPVRT